jgi:DNA replication protein DnaC
MQPISDFIDQQIERMGTSPPPPIVARPLQHPVKLSELDVSHTLVKGAVDMCKRWAKRMRRGETGASMVLVGPYGTGKTHIARAVLWSICLTIEGGVPVSPAGKFFHATDLMQKLNPTRTDWGGFDIPLPSTFIGTAPIVVIDDVGSEQTIPFIKAEDQTTERQARYFRVIDYCYTFNIAVVITSNLSIRQLEKHLGGRAWDRLCQMAPTGFMFDLSGVPSWRQKESGR